MIINKFLGLGLCLLAWGAFAQVASDDPDWKEATVPAPPAFNKDKLIPIEMPRYVTLAFGVDPATLAIAPDGIVHHVGLLACL